MTAACPIKRGTARRHGLYPPARPRFAVTPDQVVIACNVISMIALLLMVMMVATWTV